jgi:hypothetical protein
MTRVHETIELTHLLVVTYEDDPAGPRFRAECSCGWSGDWHDDHALAEADGDDHRGVVVGPADGLDRLMGELLDLQDDLAQAVMWLAENWSADLPTPHAYGNGAEPINVTLLAYCGSADELTRAAAVLGMPLVDDPAPNTQGVRYRRAVRRFGSVELHVYRALAPVCGECGTELTGDRCPTCGERADARAVTLGAA